MNTVASNSQSKMKNWLVIHQKEGKNTVNTMKIIDAWSSTANERANQALMLSMENQKRYLTEHGEGTVRLVESKKAWWL